MILYFYFHYQVTDEGKYLKASKKDRLRQLQELRARISDISADESSHKNILEDEIQSNINEILSSDISRKVAYQLAFDENQQIVAVRLRQNRFPIQLNSIFFYLVINTLVLLFNNCN